MQEEGYYPFGLEMKAISSQAAMKMQTRYKFNGGTELEASFDVDYYETYFRQYDAQIGRFTGIDMLAELTPSLTPYHFGADDPNYWNDPTGLSLLDPNLPEVTVTYHLNSKNGLYSPSLEMQELMTNWNFGYGGDNNSFNENGNDYVYGGGSGGSGDGYSSRIGSGPGGGNSNSDGPGPGKPKKGFIGPGLVPIITFPNATTVLTELPKGEIGGFWGPILTVLSFSLSFHGDNVSIHDILKRKAIEINDLIKQGKPLPDKIEYNYRGHKNDDEIVFRYITEDEFKGMNGMYLPNLDASKNLTKKYVTPDFYTSSETAWRRLALPDHKQYLVWTFKSMLEPTITPWTPVPGISDIQTGGGLEGTIFQIFPVMGAFLLGK
ncbi:MAG: hypothetical protein JST21_05285 [Bacteroidetes bacterium]|nr:hypothetical protein [Bacteroidota bacterium]